MIRFDQVSKTYSATHSALSDVSVEIPDRSFVFLIGPSGAGKTSILRLILRDMVPTSGSVFVDDLEVNKLKKSAIHKLRRKVGMIFQDFKLLSDRTVYENIALALEILGKKDHEIKKGVVDVIELVGLTGKEKQFPAQLSAGEMQRVSIARAIVGGPSILLADEPTGNLDPENSMKIVEILEEVNKIGTTLVMATHNADIVNQFKKRTITLGGGKILRDEEKGRYHTAHREKSKENA